MSELAVIQRAYISGRLTLEQLEARLPSAIALTDQRELEQLPAPKTRRRRNLERLGKALAFTIMLIGSWPILLMFGLLFATMTAYDRYAPRGKRRAYHHRVTELEEALGIT